MRTTINYTLAAGIAAALMMTGAGCADSTAPADEQLAVVKPVVSAVAGYNYYDQTTNFKFKFQVPKSWEKDETIDDGSVNIAFYSPQVNAADPYRENVNVTAISIPSGEKLSLKELADESHKALENSVQNLKPTDAGEVTLGGVKAHKYTFTADIVNPDDETQKQTLKGVEYFVIYNQTAYDFTATDATKTFDAFLPTAEKIFATVEFK